MQAFYTGAILISKQNVEIVRNARQAYERGDIEAFLALCDPAVVWDQTHYVSGEFDAVYNGREAIARFLGEWREFFESYYSQAEEYIDAGEAVLARVRQGGRGKHSGATVQSAPYWVISRVRGALVVRIEFYRDEGEALKAAGLAD
jgi:ketosteroid isomerase-like protein